MDTNERYLPGTTPNTGFVSTAFEACESFDGGPDGTPVCADCGWLVTEHEPVGAEVRVLPARRPQSITPKRLAS